MTTLDEAHADNLSRRLKLAKRVGRLEGSIKGAVMALRHGRDARVVADSLESVLLADMEDAE